MSARWWQSKPHENRMAIALVVSWGVHMLLLLPSGGYLRPAPPSLAVRLAPMQVTLQHAGDAAALPVLLAQRPNSDALASPSTVRTATPGNGQGLSRERPNAASSLPEPIASVPDPLPDSLPLAASLPTPGQANTPPEASVAYAHTAVNPDFLKLPWDSLADGFVYSRFVDRGIIPGCTLQFLYPDDPALRAKSGVLEMEILINEFGQAVATRTLSSTLPPEFAEFAGNAIQSSCFIPATMQGATVKVRRVILLNYDPVRGLN